MMFYIILEIPSATLTHVTDLKHCYRLIIIGKSMNMYPILQ